MGRERTLLPLTSLRFVAAAMIVLLHGLPVAQLPSGSPSLAQGVSFFFVLSGFILAYRYPKLANSAEVRTFLTFRIARIWPAHAVTAVAAALILSLPIDGRFIANLAMIHGWIPNKPWYFSYNAVSWSISTEFFFYLAFPVLIIAWSRTFWWKLALCGLLLGTLMIVGRDLHLPDLTSITTDSPSLHGLLYISPLARLLEFAAGMATCSAFRWADPKVVKVPRWLFTVAEIAVIALVVWLLADHMFRGIALRVLPSSAEQYLLYCDAWPGACLTVFVFAFQRGAVSRVLSIGPALLLGEISYSLYLVHTTVFHVIVEFLDIKGIVAFVLGCAVSLIVAWILWRAVEVPARTAVRRLAVPSTALRPAVA